MIYMKFNGKTIGNVAIEGYEGWTQLNKITLGVERPIEEQSPWFFYSNPPKGASLEKIEIEKPLDALSGELYQALLKNTANLDVEIHVVNFNNGKPQVIYKLVDAFVSAYELKGEYDGAPEEKVRLTFKSIQTTFPLSPDGGLEVGFTYGEDKPMSW